MYYCRGVGPSLSLSVSLDANVPDTVDLFGKVASDLQNDISISDDNKITGTLKYISDYTGFDPSNPELQSGNYIVLHADTGDVTGATITVTVTNPVILDDDRIMVLRIADKDSQTITVVASKEGYETVTKVFDISGLTTLNQAEEQAIVGEG